MGSIRQPNPRASSEPAVEAVRMQLQRMLKTRTFSATARITYLLKYGVEAALEGRTNLSEYAIAVDAFGKDLNFDPRIDPTVRVCARRLRSKLTQYYETEGASDPIEILLPMRSYVPVFRARVLRPPTIAGLSAASPVESILALPFTSLREDAQESGFASTLTEEVIHALTQSDFWRVLSWKKGDDTSRNLHQIAKMMEVQACLGGAVNRTEHRLRVFVELTSVPERVVLWSGIYEAEISSGFDSQKRIANEIFKELRVWSVKYSNIRRTRSEEARKAYLKGRYWFQTCRRDSLQKCTRQLRQSLAVDPEFGAAHATLAEALVVMAMFGESPPAGLMKQAKQEAENALQSGDVAYGHVGMGLVASLYQWDWTAAESSFRRAIEMDPGLACGHQWYASACLAPAGRFEEAAAQLKYALELDPLSIMTLNQFALVLLAAQSAEAALKYLSECLDLDSDVAITHWSLGSVLMALDRTSEAIHAFQQAVELSGGASYALGSLAHAFAEANQPRAAMRIVEQLQQRRFGHLPSLDLGFVHLSLGNSSAAMDCFDEARKQRCSRLVWVNIDPRIERLRGNPRYEALIQELLRTSGSKA